jgi:hypothetical protein
MILVVNQYCQQYKSLLNYETVDDLQTILMIVLVVAGMERFWMICWPTQKVMVDLQIAS